MSLRATQMCLYLLVTAWSIHVIVHAKQYTKHREQITRLHDRNGEISIHLARHIIDNIEQFDLLDSKFETMDNVISKDDKRKIRIHTTVAAIKEHLSPNALCPETLHSGELLRISSAVVDLSDRYAVSPALVLGIIQQESSFCRRAKSPVGAQGYMQLMPQTAKQVSNEIGIALNVWSSRDNIHLGIAYISQLLTMFNGDVDLAVKAYNAGPNHVLKVQAGVFKEYYRETADYAVKVQKFMKDYELFGVTW